MRLASVATIVSALAFTPWFEGTGRAEAQAVPRPVLAREPAGGLLVTGVWLGSGLIAFSSSNDIVNGAAGVVFIGTNVFSIADAALAAERFNRRHATTPPRAAVATRTREQ